MSALAIPRMDPALYLDLDRSSQHKSEYLDGIMYAMAGWSPSHAFLNLALGAELRQALRGTKCRAFSSDLRIGASSGTAYFYPDVSVVCGEIQTLGGIHDVTTNPTLIAEVLSESTEAFDRGEKFHQYQKIESLREYVLVSQSEPRIEIFARQTDGSWTRTEFAGRDSVCRFESLDCEIPLAAIYEEQTA